ncbi:MAG: hypothetical protein ABI832_04250 [bacterium]
MATAAREMAMRAAWVAVVAMLAAGPALAGPTAAELGKGLGMTISAQGEVENACGETVTASVTEIDFGGKLGVTYLLVIPGGPNTAGCYGDVPGDSYLLATGSQGFKVVFSGGGTIVMLSTEHGGVHDFAIGGPGFSFPLYVWNGKSFVPKGEISEATLGADTIGSYPY